MCRTSHRHRGGCFVNEVIYAITEVRRAFRRILYGATASGVTQVLVIAYNHSLGGSEHLSQLFGCLVYLSNFDEGVTRCFRQYLRQGAAMKVNGGALLSGES